MIRSCVKVVLVHRGKLLVNQCYNEKDGDYFALPGGGQNPFESVEEAIKREMLEETGYQVKIGKMIAFFEVISEDEAFRKERGEYAHKSIHVFECSLENEDVLKPTEYDAHQVASVWIPLEEVNEINLYPMIIKENIITLLEKKEFKFLGSEYVRDERT